MGEYYLEGRSMSRPAIMIGLGEVLWDLLPSGKVLGGAPANFAYMANVLGDEGIVVSRVGNDELGREARAAMQKLGLSTSHVQEDTQYPTGIVSVQIDAAGQPEFKIRDSVSWDWLEWTPAWADLAARADVICFGSLAQRSPISRATVQRFLEAAPKHTLRVYDVNLRESFYSRELLQESLKLSHIAKLNDEELFRVSDLLGVAPRSEEVRARGLLVEYGLRLICVTRGARGSLLVSKDKTVEHKGFNIRVADAVGAGDAFTACLAHHYIRGEALDNISESANRFSAWVATQVGATPPIHGTRLQEALDRAVPD
jgi:fructokinase